MVNYKDTNTDDKRTIFVVSDLHMGDGGPRDNFAVDDKEAMFNKFLDLVESENAKLYILGDLFDFWQGNFGDIIMARKKLLDRLANMDTAYIVGNHDWDLGSLVDQDFINHNFFKTMRKPFSQVIGDKKFYFMHGHEVERHKNQQRPAWGRILAILAGIMEDRKGSPMLSAGGIVEKTLIRASRIFMWIWNFALNHLDSVRNKEHDHDFDTELTPSQNPQLVPKVLKLYEIARVKNNCDVVVAGHTHRARNESWYCNPGCWVGSRNSYLRIDTSGKIELFEWKK